MGGTALAKENAVGYGETAIDEPSSIASVPEGYKWVGWTTRSGSEGDYTYRVFNFDTQVYGDVELYPYSVSYTHLDVYKRQMLPERAPMVSMRA